MAGAVSYWETANPLPDQPAFVLDYAAIWQAADKVMYSRTLDAPSTARTRIDRDFGVDAVCRLMATSDLDVSIRGPELAGLAIRAGLVDEHRQFLSPVVVGGGKRCLSDDVRIDRELLDERPFGNGVTYLAYRAKR